MEQINNITGIKINVKAIEQKKQYAYELIKEFTSLPVEVQKQRHERFNEACKDVDLEEMYELSRGVK